MSTRDLQATIILLDNSMSSLNGDYEPTRLDAEKTTVEVLARNFVRGNRESCVGFGTLAGACGINTSLTKDMRKFRMNLDDVKRDGTIRLEQAVKCAIYALRHRPKEINMRRLIILIGSQHDLSMEAAERLATFTKREGVIVDLFVFGDDEINMEPLHKYIELLGSESRFAGIPKSSKLLCDAVQDALLTSNDPMSASPMDDEMAMALAASRAEAGIDAGQDFDDEMQRAIMMSMAEFNDRPAPIPDAADAPEDDDLLDPELQEAIRLSQMTMDEIEVAPAEDTPPAAEDAAPSAEDTPPAAEDAAPSPEEDPELQAELEEAIRLSQLSMEELNEQGKEEPQKEEKDDAQKKEIEDMLNNTDEMDNLLSELGVDPSLLKDKEEEQKK